VSEAKLKALETLERLESMEKGAPLDVSAVDVGAIDVGVAVADLTDDGEEMLSGKELKRRAKMLKKSSNAPPAQQQQQGAVDVGAVDAGTAVADLTDDGEEMLSGKELKRRAKMLKKSSNASPPLNDIDNKYKKDSSRDNNEDDGSESSTKRSKKELKAEKREMDKQEAKKRKKKPADDAVETGDNSLGTDSESDSRAESTPQSPPPLSEPQTLEEKVRKNRPPPQVRIMSNVQPGFVSLALSSVGVTYRNQEVLKDVSWEVKTGDRIGLVGANGGGKTTQLNILGGLAEPTTGDVIKSAADLRVSILRQEFVDELVPERPLRDEFRSVFKKENAILLKLKENEEELEKMTGGDTDGDRMQEILDEMAKLQQQANDKDAFNLDSRISKVMDLMGFTEEEGSSPVKNFSGGWKMRIGLGKVLLQDPNILLLDEPTNHLDLESVEWLESFLKNQNIPLVIVSHDREFLDQVCSKIVDTNGGSATSYEGNYSRFLKLKKEKMDSWEAKYNQQEKKIKEDKQWMQKMKVKQPVAVKQRQAKLEKFMQSDEYVKKPPFEGKPFKFRFPPAPRLSSECALVASVTHGYGGRHLLDGADMFVDKGDRIAVLGPNGSGKSTLLRLLMGKEKCDSGEAKIVGMNVVANYFEQNQADALDLNLTVEQTVEKASSDHSYNDLRKLMGQFLFKGDAVKKTVAQLSGGEKARLSLCCMMLRPANLLVLDEPTNHLDIPAKEMLEEALQYFDGAMILISHDRFFISKVATTIAAIEEKKIVIYSGDYRYYMEKNAEIKNKVESRYIGGGGRITKAVVPVLEEAKKSFGGKAPGVSGRLDKGVKNAKRMKQ